MSRLPVFKGDEPSRTPFPTDFMRRAVKLVGTQKALADRLEVSESHVARVLGGAGLGIENCVRLADLLDEDRASVLRAYGFARFSDRLYADERKGGAR